MERTKEIMREYGIPEEKIQSWCERIWSPKNKLFTIPKNDEERHSCAESLASHVQKEERMQAAKNDDLYRVIDIPAGEKIAIWLNDNGYYETFDNHNNEILYNFGIKLIASFKWAYEESSFRESFITLRSKKELSQEELSNLTDIPKRTIEDWETGKRTPPPYIQKLILRDLETII